MKGGFQPFCWAGRCRHLQSRLHTQSDASNTKLELEWVLLPLHVERLHQAHRGFGLILLSELVQSVWGRCGRRSGWDESDSPSQTRAHDTETISHVLLNTRGPSSPSGLNRVYSRGTGNAWNLLWSEPDDPRPVQRCACLQSHDKPL